MSVPDKQNSCCGDGDGTVHCLQVMTMCRTVPTAAECPPVVVLGERVGRGQGEPDGGRDRHDGRARPRAEAAAAGVVGTREHPTFGSCT